MEKKSKERKKLHPVIKIAISVILGFLPSFLFIIFFIQYGSPFSNYIKFLSNFSSSWAAWISAIIIAFLTYFMGTIIRSLKHLKIVLKNKFLLVILIVCLLIVIILASTQMYLYVNFTLRNDILTKLSTDQNNIYFTNNSQENVSFLISATMNPFCSAQCQYNFFDISTGKEIENGSFNFTSILTETKKYTFYNNHFVQGSQETMRFQVSCWSAKTFLCYTKSENSTRAIIITVNYNLTAEDAQYKNDSKNQLISLGQDLYSAYSIINESANNINSINNSFLTENFSETLNNLSGIFSNLSSLFKDMKNLWEMQNFTELRNEFPTLEDQMQNFSNSFVHLNSEINSSIDTYNNITTNLNADKYILTEISNMNMTASLCTAFNSAISDFNNAISGFINVSSISNKESIEGNISVEVNSLYNNMSNSIGTSCSLTNPINNYNITKITINPPSEILIQNFSLDEPSPICCYLGQCGECCNETCSNENYPVIFVHGYSFSKAVPIGYGLDTFNNIKEKLSSEDYIDAGGIIISSINEEKGLWGKINAPIEISASYFFDTYQTDSTESTVSSDTDSIDTFAIRLKNLIDIMKYRTNKDKVIIVAHSMGGLVTRRYLQIFGGNDVSKVILITTPNHGISGKVESYCGVFGPTIPCSEMNQDSLFINQLNTETEIVPTYNIIGIGCDMGTETGDGILTNSTQYLNYATNYYVNGTCDELNFDYFHEDIIDPNQYPEVYNIIKNIIKG